jgi:(p)ppGpp synthase/HD superfamily hydrolase
LDRSKYHRARAYSGLGISDRPRLTGLAMTYEQDDLLALAIRFAFEVHRGQVDKLHEPYILHPLRVMIASMRMTCGQQEYIPRHIAAVLHDVVEDTPTTLSVVSSNFGPQVAHTVDLLSRRQGLREPYGDYIERLSHDPVARCLKLLDLADNMARLPDLWEREPAIAHRLHIKYEEARERLT